MYGWSNKAVRESKSRKKIQNTSFSSSLLDEIYRSMELGDDKTREFKLWDDKGNGARDSGGGRARASGAVEDEGIATLRRAFMVHKWMDIKVNAKNFTQRKRASSLPDSDRDRNLVSDNDPFWSSDAVSRWSQKPSCFGPARPKLPRPIKTDASRKKHQLEDDYRLDDNHTSRINLGDLMNSNMNKLKPPISPGGRLTTFLNGLFTNGRLKKPKDLNSIKIKSKSKSAQGSTCSSASSFTRSCLSKHSPRSREKLNKGNRRTVRFYPVSAIFDEDCRPCGEKVIFSEQDIMKVHVTTMLEDKCANDEDDDFASDASSDLFELDHLKDCDELPVYETTHFGTNRAIADGLIC